MSNKQPVDPNIGRNCAGKYLITKVIAHGGMSSLYEATDTQLNRTVALKFIHHQSDPEVSQRFAREVQTLAALNHPNIVTAKAVHAKDRGEYVLVMEFLNGQDLSKFLEENGPLSRQQFKSIFSQVCSALSFAHSKEVIHRDLKPSNIMLVKQADGSITAKVLDFGLAKLKESSGTQKLTTTGTVIGSPSYMSPEQSCGHNADQRSDIYSLACVMHEALSGKTPFASDTPMASIFMHMNQTLPPIEGAHNRALSTVLLKAAAIDPADRFDTVDQLWSAVEADKPVGAVIHKKPTRIPTGWAMALVAMALAGAATWAMLSNQQLPMSTLMANYRGYGDGQDWTKLDACFEQLKNDPRLDARLAEDIETTCFYWDRQQSNPAIKKKLANWMVTFGLIAINKRRAEYPHRSTANMAINIVVYLNELQVHERRLEVIDHELKLDQSQDRGDGLLGLHYVRGLALDETKLGLGTPDLEIARPLELKWLKQNYNAYVISQLQTTSIQLCEDYLQKGRFQQALDAANDWFIATRLSDQSAMPKYPSPYINTVMELYRARAYYSMGQSQRAAESYQEALRIAKQGLLHDPSPTDKKALQILITKTQKDLAALNLPSAK